MQGQWDPDSDNDRRERASASQQRLSFEYGSRVDPLLDRAASHVPLIGAAFKTTTTTLARWLAHAPIRRARYEDFSSIDWIYDNNKGRRARRRLRQGSQRTLKGKLYLFYDSLQSWIVLLGVGIAMGIIATFMATTSQWMSDIKGGYCRGRFYLNKRFCCLEAIDQSTNESRPCEDWIAWSDALHISWPWMAWLVQSIAFVCSGVLFAGLSTYLVTEYAPYAAGQGIAEIKTIMSGFVMRQFLGLRTLVVKCIGTPLSVASGLNVGKEAPLVHIACCCGNVLTRPFPSLRGNESQKRQVLSAASAAGISVAFGAPIGGVLFSLEEVSYYFPAETMWRSFFCASVAAITLKFFDPFRNGKLVPFQVTYDRTFYPFELLFVVVIGVIGVRNGPVVGYFCFLS
ncbi:hypothetical protein EV182_004947 [Spiromyces aspiralis]|uniref:Uncharacterized protein n=1 Tax=Spiromyces aspiralis TaxID=68401 RepID=A0ACC1HNZ2_9FUNG|nr:hypothetical protein EV182_004947 [Spiromyces aspiralis]